MAGTVINAPAAFSQQLGKGKTMADKNTPVKHTSQSTVRTGGGVHVETKREPRADNVSKNEDRQG